MKLYILYNPLSGKGKTKEELETGLEAVFAGETSGEKVYIDVTETSDYRELISALTPEDRILICGGDGTLYHFVNSADVESIPCGIYFLASGTGNDFLRDVAPDSSGKPVDIGRYLVHLPEVTVKGRTHKFLNNVGFGIDGYCTEVGDEMRAAHKENINYAGIAIKGLLGKFDPLNAKVTVDGVTKEYKNAWLAPTMNGRFYGGGMMAAPAQDRLNEEHTVSVMVFHGKSRLLTLCAFPSIFKGEHIRNKKRVEILTGKNITVEFDRETPLQIDGETVKNVLKYEVHAYPGEHA